MSVCAACEDSSPAVFFSEVHGKTSHILAHKLIQKTDVSGYVQEDSVTSKLQNL